MLGLDLRTLYSDVVETAASGWIGWHNMLDQETISLTTEGYEAIWHPPEASPNRAEVQGSSHKPEEGHQDAQPSVVYDLAETCPGAAWQVIEEEVTIQYRIPGAAPCALLSQEVGGIQLAWRYEFVCRVKDKQFRSRRNDRTGCVEEVCVWLKHVGCPGAVFPAPKERHRPFDLT